MAMSNTIASIWADETKVELLRKLWADGLSASQIADQIGGVSRNAIIGKLHRLGLSLGSGQPNRTPKERKAAKPRRMRTKPVFNFGSIFGAYPSEQPAAKPYVPKAADLVTVAMPLLMLTDHRCKFTADDGPFLFCGLPVKPGTSYCPGHAKLCFTEIASRNRYTERHIAYVADTAAQAGSPMEVAAA